MKYNSKWYWGKSPQQNDIIIPKRTIVHPCLGIIAANEVRKTKKCNKNQPCNAIKIRYICLTDFYHDYILNEIKQIYTIEYDRKMSVDDICE